MQYYLIVSGHHKLLICICQLKIAHNICQWTKKIYQWHNEALSCAKKCAKKTEHFHLFFPQFSPMITSDITIVHYPIQENGIGAILLTNFQILCGFHQLLHVSFFSFFGVYSSMNFITCMDLCNQLPQ